MDKGMKEEGKGGGKTEEMDITGRGRKRQRGREKGKMGPERKGIKDEMQGDRNEGNDEREMRRIGK